MQWPTLIVDNFFTDPHAIVSLSQKFKYKRDEENKWPGTRTSSMHEVDSDFFRWSTRKIMALLYPVQVSGFYRNVGGVQWQAKQYFQRISGNTYGKEGWVHGDGPSEFTSIIYLSDHEDSGTCLYKGKQFNALPTHLDEKERFYKDLKNRKRMEKYRDKNNSKFRKKVELFSNFNRLVLFDAYDWHASRNPDSSKSDRLTLITFFSNIAGENIAYPITQMRRV